MKGKDAARAKKVGAKKLEQESWDVLVSANALVPVTESMLRELRKVGFHEEQDIPGEMPITEAPAGGQPDTSKPTPVKGKGKR